MAPVDLERITDEEYFERMQGLFTTQGWQVFLAELQDNATNINSVEDTLDANNLHYRKGQLSVISDILNLQTTTELADTSNNESPE